MYVRRRGLLIPADTANATELRGQLSADRDLTAVANEHQWRQLAQDAEHTIRLSDVAEIAARAKQARDQRVKDAREAAKLRDLYRTAKNSGARAKIRADILGSAEMRALRVAKVRTIALIAGLPILLAFAAWSTTGVQAGVVKLLKLDETDPGWWSAWGVEPALIALVALIIIGRAILRSSGGDTDWRADLAEWGALGTSLGLNMYGGWDAPGWAGLGPAVTHSIGPIFAAGTAFLIGLFDSYVTQAKPWDDAHRIDDIDFGDAPETTHLADASAPLQLPETHLPELPADAPVQPALTRAANPGDAAPTQRGASRRSARPVRRSKSASSTPTSGDAPGTDAATRGAKLVLTQGLSNRKAASQVGGTSEASVRRRVKELRDAGHPAAPADAADDAEDERVNTDLNLPFLNPAPAVTAGVNGHHPSPQQETPS